MIKELKLKNWKSHLDSSFQFGGGTNVLVGIMGSGKSSVLSAISFALFGTFPALRSREVTLDEVIMERPQRKKEASVELTFEIEGDEFEVKRKVERGKGTTEANIRKNGEMLDSGVSRTSEIIEKYLKVDYELFSSAVYSEQDGLDYFLEIPKGQRMKRIDNLLRIDRFENCRSNTTTLINRISDMIASKSDMIDEIEKNEDFDEIEDLNDEISDLKDKLENKRKKLEKKSKKYENAKEELKNIKEGIEEVKSLNNKKSSIKGALDNIKEDIKSLKDEVELGKGKIEERLEEIKEELEELNSKKEELEGEIEELEGKEKGKKVRIKDLQSRIQKLKSVEGECPICGSELTEEHKSELEKERREKISKLADEKGELEESIEEKEEKLEDRKENIDELEEERKEIKKKREKLEELEGKKEKLSEKKEKLNDIDEKLEGKKEKYDQEKIDRKEEELQKLSGKKEEIKAGIKSDKKFLSNKKDRLKELKERKETLENYRKEIRKSKELNEDLKKFRNALKSTQEQLRTRFIEAVNKTLGKIWSSLYPYEDFSDVRLAIKEGDYELQFRSERDWHSVEGIASGGERTSACLALRIAFALVLAPNLKWLVLDEPTHNLDRRAVEDLAELLRTKVSEFVDQVFLITHDETMESAANSYLYKLEREKERNEPTEVKEIT